MRVPTHSASNTTIELIQKLNAQQIDLQTKVATGQRISKPSDDPASVGRLIGLQANQQAAQQYVKNGQKALEISQVAFDGLDQMRSVSDRAGELATLASGTIGNTQLDAYAKEINQLIEHALQLANSSFNGNYIFGGNEVKSEPFAFTRDASGNLNAITYAGEADAAAIQISESSLVVPRPKGETNQGLATFIGQLIELRDALESGDLTNLGTIRSQLESSENMLVGAISDQGTVQMRIEVNLKLQQAWQENIANLMSAEADIDMPTAIVQLSQATLSYEAALSASSRILNLSILDYLR